MNPTMLQKIAEAVLYEGYMLYPYRPSVKNCQRWTFGGLYPEAFCCQQGDRSFHQAEVLVQGDGETRIDVNLRFLHLTERTVGELRSPWIENPGAPRPSIAEVPVLRVGQREFVPWQEAEERSFRLNDLNIGSLDGQRRAAFAFAGRRWLEPIAGDDGTVAGMLARQQRDIHAAIEIAGITLAEGLFKLTVRVQNTAQLPDGVSRDEALRHTMLSAHTALEVRGGALVSLLDPPAELREAVSGCQNIGVWPVLVGQPGERHTMLASPIILYDYPQVAPESPTNLFDGCEIDEILTLRIMTLTEDEKRAAAAVDGRVEDLLRQTESLARTRLEQLHGTVRPFQEVAP